MVTVQAKSLQELVGRVALVACKDSSIAVFRQVCLRGGLMSAYDGCYGVISRSPFPDICCCVPADRLETVVRGLSGDIAVSQVKHGLVLKSGRHTTRLQTADATPFPEILPTHVWPYYTGADFVAALERIAFCASDESARTARFSGAGFRGRYCYATDGHRASRADLSGEVESPISIPRGALRRILSFGEPSRIHRDDNRLVCSYDEHHTVVVASVSALAYPFDAIDQQFGRVLRPADDCVFPDEMVSATQRVCGLLGTQSHKEIRLENTAAGVLTVRSVESEIGLSEEQLSWDYQTPFQVKLDAGLFIDAVKRTRKGNLTDVVTGGRSHIRFYGKEFEHVLALRAE